MQRSLWAVAGNSQRLDGGAMFGNAPRAMWEKWITPDERHRIPLACRTLLIKEVDGDKTRHILFETGIGVFFEPKLKDRFGVVESEHMLLSNLDALGLAPDDIDVVVLSHLHFDHAGGLLTAYREGQDAQLVFPKAHYVVGATAFERNQKPHSRDRASFIPELPQLLEQTGKLELIDGERSSVLGPDYRFHMSCGHTPGLMLTEIPSEKGPIVFAADLIPGRPWMHLPITMGYDRFPEALIDEKKKLLTDLLARGGRLFFTHDHAAAMSVVSQDDRGRFGPGETWETPQGLSI